MYKGKHQAKGKIVDISLLTFATTALALGASMTLTGEPTPAQGSEPTTASLTRHNADMSAAEPAGIPAPEPGEAATADITDPGTDTGSDDTDNSASGAVELCPMTAYGDQSAVDTGGLVLWSSSPFLIAGHDNMGWDWLDDIATGTTVSVTCGPASGTYVVTGHQWQETKGGQMPSWMYSEDLILQTCTGSTGMGFSILQRA